MNEAKLFGMKSHDCHVFFQRLLLGAFKALPNHIWTILTEFSLFFKEICAFELNVDKLRQLEESVPIMLCRFLRTLKCKIKILRYVEGSITEAFLVEKASKFASYYYPPEVISRWRGVPRNDDGGVPSGQISIFNYPGRVVGKHYSSTLEGSNKKVAEWYILNNCEEAALYLKSIPSPSPKPSSPIPAFTTPIVSTTPATIHVPASRPTTAKLSPSSSIERLPSHHSPSPRPDLPPSVASPSPTLDPSMVHATQPILTVPPTSLDISYPSFPNDKGGEK
ncbi:hypothetical protein K1719_016598 [Acacia pycnantha]|nr:hypothetical protein K1719_016598 [Acacia pycnantha]